MHRVCPFGVWDTWGGRSWQFSVCFKWDALLLLMKEGRGFGVGVWGGASVLAFYCPVFVRKEPAGWVGGPHCPHPSSSCMCSGCILKPPIPQTWTIYLLFLRQETRDTWNTLKSPVFKLKWLQIQKISPGTTTLDLWGNNRRSIMTAITTTWIWFHGRLLLLLHLFHSIVQVNGRFPTQLLTHRQLVCCLIYCRFHQFHSGMKVVHDAVGMLMTCFCPGVVKLDQFIQKLNESVWFLLLRMRLVSFLMSHVTTLNLCFLAGWSNQPPNSFLSQHMEGMVSPRRHRDSWSRSRRICISIWLCCHNEL